MRYFMFGMDGERPEESARQLRAKGIDAIVSPPSERAAAAAREAGMEVWGCIGAFSVREGDPEEFLAEDVFGKRKKWFGSGCPNEEALWERGFAQIDKWKAWGADGVFSDGARFASPCPGDELYASCFCPRCMALGKELGFDMQGMKRRVRLYMTMPDLLPPADWLRFRAQCMQRWYDAFVQRVCSAGLRSGAFVFTPGLSGTVGQTKEALGQFDVLSPMLYRLYRPRPGIATLNDEYASLFALYRSRGDTSPVKTIGEHAGMEMPHASEEEIRQNGFGPEAIGSETQRAAQLYGRPVAPIIQLEDDRLEQSIACAAKAGAEAIGFFAYTCEGMERLPDLNKTEG